MENQVILPYTAFVRDMTRGSNQGFVFLDQLFLQWRERACLSIAILGVHSSNLPALSIKCFVKFQQSSIDLTLTPLSSLYTTQKFSRQP